MVEDRQQRLLRALWSFGKLSRWELHEQTGLTPNSVGTLADTLIRSKLVRELPPEATKMGRPRVPLEIDPAGRHMLGVALVPGRVEISRLGLRGSTIDSVVSEEVAHPSHLVSRAVSLIEQHLNSDTLGVGVSITGFIDLSSKSVLFSSALQGQPVQSVEPIFDAVDQVPVVLGNDMHAIAARWLLAHRAEQKQDVLLVRFIDGRMGSALLIDGRPNRGSVMGANELGHSRFLVETDLCFCGQMGCLERIVSTPFVARRDRSAGMTERTIDEANLLHRAEAYVSWSHDLAIDSIIHYLALALSNAVNFIRPHRLVLLSPLTRHKPFVETLVAHTRRLILQGLDERTQIDLWDQPASHDAENAAWLAMAELLYGGWDTAEAETTAK